MIPPTNKWHRSVTPDRVLAACMRQLRTLDDPGFCLHCGMEQLGCEPDMRNGKCAACGYNQVFGAAELAIVVGTEETEKVKRDEVLKQIIIEDET